MMAVCPGQISLLIPLLFEIEVIYFLSSGGMVGLYIIAATLLSRYRKFLFLRCQDAL